jgi:SAM-dependent methyltransferase
MLADPPATLAIPNRHQRSTSRPERARHRQVVDPDVIYRHVSAGHPSWISDTAGVRRPLHIDRWIGGANSTQQDRDGDEAILELCEAPTIDVGCGPGRFAAALAARGVPVLGVDISATAVEMTAQRGAPAFQGDVFDAMPGIGTWKRVLLADGNIGIGGDPVRMLRRARQLLHPAGLVVAEIDSRQTGVSTRFQRWETHHHVGRWFPWAHVGSDAAEALASASGLVLRRTVECWGRCIVAMSVV